MSIEIINLEPKEVWKNFFKLTQIPRPSKKEEKIIEFMKKFGQDLKLETIVDEVGNVIIRKPATKGMENRKVVILQGHLDMVPQKNSDKQHDFEKDPIDAYIEGEVVKAKGTTLGADNGMGVAAAMALLEANDIEHGPIEAFFTVDEETGMTGAFGLKPGLLKGDILLNLDSEHHGELFVGCAGGTNANIKLTFKKENTEAAVVAYKLSLTGLKGGHSGLDIVLGRGNANKLMNRFLKHATIKHNVRISEFNGGSLRNAIPREAFAIITVPADKEQDLIKCIEKYENVFKAELSNVEPDLKFKAEKTKNPDFVMDKLSQMKFINSVYACPNGVIRMSDSIPDLVETSTNLASIKFENNNIFIQCLMRSSVDSAKDDLGVMISSVFELAGAEIVLDGSYPGWKPNMNSAILKVMKDVYIKLYGGTPDIKAIHAGLECGLLGGVYPNFDMISFGPTIRFPHSPDEEVNIASVNKFWNYLLETLKHIPVKS
ncbi:MAG: aminoacyl-histidine dipeptidase [Bacteroidales bacterium]|nr:aminoacyl-histidine dipeptidase [Bacteroidales bacterium]